MANEESEVRLTLLEQTAASDDNNNLQFLDSSGTQEVEESFTEEATVHSDDPLSQLLSSSQQLALNDSPKVVIVPTKNAAISRSCTSIATKKHGLELVWRDLSYEIKKKSWVPFRKATSRKLIHNLNGGIQSGQLTAIIGPSGAGKTTLIECLSGRRVAGVSGDIEVNYNGVSKSSIKVSYYSQRDSLNELLTVDESLMYASQLSNCLKSSRRKNALLSTGIDVVSHSQHLKGAFPDGQVELEELNQRYYHRIVVERMLEELNLKKCANVLVAGLSGGQKRRLSIALELIFSPSIIILDEPTSGLDSLSSLQCISMLKKLVTSSCRPMIIACSIHQPTARIMSYFDHLYIISCNGQCIFNGPTSDLVPTLSRFGLSCPQYHNPADHVVEIASGDYGFDCIDLLAENFKQVCAEQVNESEKCQSKVKMLKLVQKTQKHSIYKQILTTVILTKRTMVTSMRDPNIYISRLVTTVSTLALLAILYKDEKIGILDGCAQRPTRGTVDKFQSMEIFDTRNSFYGNFGFIFFTVVFTIFMTILPTLLRFPLEVSVFIKENFNGWYSLKSYYIAHQIVDLPPMFIFPMLFGTVSYFITYQFFEWPRFILFQSILVGLAFLAQGVGFLVSSYFVNDVTTSAVVGAIINIPLFLFTGLLIKISIMPKFFQPITYLSYFRLAFESLLVTIYGLNRCDPVEPMNFSYLKSEFGDQIVDMFVCINDFSPTATDNITQFIDNYNEHFLTNVNQSSSSYALKNFNYNDQTLYFNVGIMFLYIIILRVIAYLVLYRKTKVK